MIVEKKQLKYHWLNVILVLGSLFFPTLIWAHHSTAGRFSPDESIVLQGQVTGISWRNPHSIIELEVTEGSNAGRWEVEAIGMTSLRRSGVDLDQLSKGDRVIIGGPASMLDKKETYLRYLVIDRGGEKTAFIGTPPEEISGTGNPAPTGIIAYREFGETSHPELGLFRVWVTAGFVILYPNKDDVFPLTEEGKRLKASFNPLTDNPTLNCNPKGMPLIMEQPYPLEFTRQGDDILLALEEYDTRRYIHMNQDAVPPGITPSMLGYSRGWWEGETLVVSTTHIDWPWLSQSGIPLSSQVSLMERFTPTADGSRLDYALTINDPVMFRDSVNLGKHWVYLEGLEVETYNCQ